ncbi:hypothetical protein ABZ801_09065 [Actinomadura sp. NPDC047616]|uniref:hypothetical protein n=1 Tax=Actinomadura sp. NPDC047616 TaxID=3155914 RepID=UPI0033F095EF
MQSLTHPIIASANPAPPRRNAQHACGAGAAEFFTALGGLGGVIVEAGHSFQPDRMFAAVVVLMVAAVVLTWLIGLAERRIAPWNRSLTGDGQ